jgi:hypothetical protein
VIVATTVGCTLLFFLLERRSILGFYQLFFGPPRPLNAPGLPAEMP